MKICPLEAVLFDAVRHDETHSHFCNCENGQKM